MSVPFDKALDAVSGANDSSQRYPLKIGMKLVPHDDPLTAAKHTPGPWYRNIKPASKYVTVWAGRNTHVAKVVTDGLTEEEIEGNIELIAAAPETARQRDLLLEAVKYADECFEAAYVEGLSGALADSNYHEVGSLGDLVNRRILPGREKLREALAACGVKP